MFFWMATSRRRRKKACVPTLFMFQTSYRYPTIPNATPSQRTRIKELEKQGFNFITFVQKGIWRSRSSETLVGFDQPISKLPDVYPINSSWSVYRSGLPVVQESVAPERGEILRQIFLFAPEQRPAFKKPGFPATLNWPGNRYPPCTATVP